MEPAIDALSPLCLSLRTIEYRLSFLTVELLPNEMAKAEDLAQKAEEVKEARRKQEQQEHQLACWQIRSWVVQHIDCTDPQAKRSCSTQLRLFA